MARCSFIRGLRAAGKSTRLVGSHFVGCWLLKANEKFRKLKKRLPAKKGGRLRTTVKEINLENGVSSSSWNQLGWGQLLTDEE